MLSTALCVEDACKGFLKDQGILDPVSFEVALTKDITKGDLYTNLPFASSKILNKNPIALAIELQKYLEEKLDKNIFEKIEVAGGYVNFWIQPLMENLSQNITHTDWTGKKIIFDYTDPNPMKEFHIGHLMSNAIGECFARLAELAGAEVKRYSYQGDVGRHIAVTIWGLQFLDKPWPDSDDISLTDKVKHLGAAYVAGNTQLKLLEERHGVESTKYTSAVKEIEDINKQVYDRSDAEINIVYDQGREWSLEKFEELYKILGTRFDRYFFESQSGPLGLEIIKSYPDIFVSGENGARIFEGEKYNLHTRVFVNKTGLPTYEGKEIGLTKMKWDAWPYDRSYVITANEQNEAFKVTKKAISMIFKEAGERAFHLGHGMMRFVGEKMSSRTGKIIAGDELVYKMADISLEKMKERPIAEENKKNIAEAVAVAAIKFTILKQNFRKDIIFDAEKALGLEGDSGPYIQYVGVRITSLLKKAKQMLDEGASKLDGEMGDEAVLLKRLLMRFEHTCFQAIDEMAPQHIAQYLIELGSTFNSFYANTKIIITDEKGVISVRGDLLDLCEKVLKVLEKGLTVLGIRIVDEM